MDLQHHLIGHKIKSILPVGQSVLLKLDRFGGTLSGILIVEALKDFPSCLLGDSSGTKRLFGLSIMVSDAIISGANISHTWWISPPHWLGKATLFEHSSMPTSQWCAHQSAMTTTCFNNQFFTKRDVRPRALNTEAELPLLWGMSSELGSKPSSLGFALPTPSLYQMHAECHALTDQQSQHSPCHHGKNGDHHPSVNGFINRL